MVVNVTGISFKGAYRANNKFDVNVQFTELTLQLRLAKVVSNNCSNKAVE